MSWTEQDLREVLRDQVASPPSAPDRAAAVHARIVRRRRRSTAALAGVLVVLMLAVGAAVSQLSVNRSMPPAGPRPGSGTILYSDTSGDIRVLDPTTGASSLLIGGPTADAGPALTPDGRHVMFRRSGQDGGQDMMYVADLDGIDATRFRSTAELSNTDYSPGNDRIASVSEGGELAVLDVASGQRRVLPVQPRVLTVSWTSDQTLLLLGGDASGVGNSLWTINADGTGLSQVQAPGMCCSAVAQRGTDTVAWTSWDAATGETGRVHLLDLSTGKDRLLASTDVDGYSFLNPVFSPDGRWLLLERFGGGIDGKQLVLVAADGSGAAVPVGPPQARNQSGAFPAFSPDSRKLLVIYADDTSTWLFDVPSGTGRKTPWQGLVEASWSG